MQYADFKKAINIISVLVSLFAAVRTTLFLYYFNVHLFFPPFIIGIYVGIIVFILAKSIFGLTGFIIVNLAMFELCIDVLFLLLNLVFKFDKHSLLFSLWTYCAFGALFTAAFIIYGTVKETVIKRRDLTFSSDKVRYGYKMAVLSDIRYGAAFSHAKLKKAVADINNESPDCVILLGDIIKKNTKKHNLEKLFKILSEIKATDGVYFIHGEEDRQMHLRRKRGKTSALKENLKNYTDAEFNALMNEAKIVCIDTNSVKVRDDICLNGLDCITFDRNKKPVQDKFDNELYNIVLEHKPTKEDKYSALGADLYLSGHYCGAQNIPNNFIYGFAGYRFCGEYDVGKMKMFVTSGVTASKFPVRTYGSAEYLIINLNN